MYRRRRTPDREPVFGFDSFLDVVTNVLGIIIRLILVAWVGARAYSTLSPEESEAPSLPAAELPPPKATDDPLHPEIARTQLEIAQARARLLDRMQQLRLVQAQKEEARRDLIVLGGQRIALKEERGQIDNAIADRGRLAQLADLSLSELKERSRSVLEQIKSLEKPTVAKKTYRYHAPVSRAVHAEELMFECHEGRVTFIDLPAFLDEVKRGLGDKGEQLKTRWQVSEVAGPIGAFRMRYALERKRGLFEGAAPTERESFSYSLSEWVLEPVFPTRGEPAEQALAAGSAFRRVIEGQDLRNTVVTFWVYPDSFALFRDLRDFLYENGAEVAGRPLPAGAPIAASRHGTASRGQ